MKILSYHPGYNRNQGMEEKNLTLDEVSSDKQECFVFTNTLPGRVWPDTIEVDNVIYRFEGNWRMPPGSYSDYSGYARFIKA